MLPNRKWIERALKTRDINQIGIEEGIPLVEFRSYLQSLGYEIVVYDFTEEIVKRYLQGVEVEEIARIMGCTTGYVRRTLRQSRIGKSPKKLRKEMATRKRNQPKPGFPSPEWFRENVYDVKKLNQFALERGYPLVPLRKYLREAGWDLVTYDVDEAIVALYNAGIPIVDIERKIGCSQTHILTVARANQLPSRQSYLTANCNYDLPEPLPQLMQAVIGEEAVTTFIRDALEQYLEVAPTLPISERVRLQYDLHDLWPLVQAHLKTSGQTLSDFLRECIEIFANK